MYRAAWLCLCLLFLTSCSRQAAVDPIVSGFRCQVDVQYENVTASGVFDRPDGETASLRLTSPKDLEGVEMRFDGQQVTLSYAGLELSVEEDQMPVGAVIKAVCEALNGCAEVQEEPSFSGEVQREGLCGSYTVQFDEENGFPVSLTVPTLELEVDFSNWETAA